MRPLPVGVSKASIIFFLIKSTKDDDKYHFRGGYTNQIDVGGVTVKV